MERAEHVEWAKGRALEQVEKYSSVAAWFGFKHDMGKLEEVRNDDVMRFLFERGDDLCRAAAMPVLKGVGGRHRILENELQRFIEDFN